MMKIKLMMVVIIFWPLIGVAQTPSTATRTSTPTRTASFTPTSTGTPTQTPTNVVDVSHHDGFIWNIFPDAQNSQPVRSWSNGGSFGISMPSSGRLQDLTAACTLGIATITVTKDSGGGVFNTALRCSYSGKTGCVDFFDPQGPFPGTGHFVNFNAGDYINIANNGGGTCRVSIGVLYQDSTEHPADVIWGFIGATQHLNTHPFCIPVSSNNLASSCRGTDMGDSFFLPTNSSILKFSRNGNPNGNGGFYANENYVFVDETSSTDIFTTTLVPNASQSSVIGTCTSGCSFTGGDQFHVRVDASGAIRPVGFDYVLEFIGTGEIRTGLDSQWSTSEARFINPNTVANPTPGSSWACQNRAGVAKNFRLGLNGSSPNLVNGEVCIGLDVDHLSCSMALGCGISSGLLKCDNTLQELVIPRGYAHAVRISSPGSNSGTVNFSYEVGPPATPIDEVGGCGIATPVGTLTQTPTPSASASVSVTPTVTNTPNAGTTFTFTQTQTVTRTPTITQTQIPTSTSTPTPFNGCCNTGPDTNCTSPPCAPDTTPCTDCDCVKVPITSTPTPTVLS